MIYITNEDGAYYPCDENGKISSRDLKLPDRGAWLEIADAWNERLIEVIPHKRIEIGHGGAGGGLVIINAKPIEITEPPENDKNIP